MHLWRVGKRHHRLFGQHRGSAGTRPARARGTLLGGILTQMRCEIAQCSGRGTCMIGSYANSLARGAGISSSISSASCYERLTRLAPVLVATETFRLHTIFRDRNRDEV